MSCTTQIQPCCSPPRSRKSRSLATWSKTMSFTLRVARWRALVVTSLYHDRQALARDDGASTETVPDVHFFTHTLRFCHPLNHDIMLASAVLPKNTIEFSRTLAWV